MNIFTSLFEKIRGFLSKMTPYRNIEQAEHVETSLSQEMTNALEVWYEMYLDKAGWLDADGVKSLNLPAFISAEIARQITLEMKWNITGTEGEDAVNPRAEYLTQEFEKLMDVLRQKLETGLAAGGMIVKPYPSDGHIYFDWTCDWSFYPLAFSNDGSLTDVIIPDIFTHGKTIYTRLERHTLTGGAVRITQRAFKSDNRNSIGVEIPLTEVERWSALQPEATVTDSGGMLFGWFKVASANNIDVTCPLGASVYAKSVNLIKEADLQYSRLLWEYEGSELAIDVDPTALRPVAGVDGKKEMPKLNERLFRAVDIDKGDRDLYEVFAPAIRDASLLNGLNQLLMRIEDLCGLSRGTIADANAEARTATELKIMRQRTYSTVADNQQALEKCLRDVIRVMDKYATLYSLAPEGDYDVSFEWDDSVITDTEQQMNERMLLLGQGVISKSEMREWYFGETKAQAQAALEEITNENDLDINSLIASMSAGDEDNDDGSAEQGGGYDNAKPPQS